MSREALARAIELNGVNIEENRRAFTWGRIAACDYDYVARVAGLVDVIALPKSLDEIIDDRAARPVEFQNTAYANRYRAFVAQVREREKALAAGSTALTEAVARYLFKFMAYNDEYEVARLYTSGDFQRRLAETFEGDYQLHFHLAPPIFNRGLDAQGRPRKTVFGPWMMSAFKLLARFRFLRGTAFDPFGYLADRREERALIDDYRALVEEVLDGLADGGDYATAVLIGEERRGVVSR